jgi:hypothetical protein
MLRATQSRHPTDSISTKLSAPQRSRGAVGGTRQGSRAELPGVESAGYFDMLQKRSRTSPASTCTCRDVLDQATAKNPERADRRASARASRTLKCGAPLFSIIFHRPT